MKFIALLSIVSCATLILAMPSIVEDSSSLVSRVAIDSATEAIDTVLDTTEDDNVFDEQDINEFDEEDLEGSCTCIYYYYSSLIPSRRGNQHRCPRKMQ